jgi:hypothetical protein
MNIFLLTKRLRKFFLNKWQLTPELNEFVGKKIKHIKIINKAILHMKNVCKKVY